MGVCSVFYVLSATSGVASIRGGSQQRPYARYDKEGTTKTNLGSTKQAWQLFNILCSISDGRAAAAIRGGAQHICTLREEARHYDDEPWVYRASVGVVQYSMFYQRRMALLRSVEVHNNVHMRATIKKQRRTTGLPSKHRGCLVFCVLSATAVALCLDQEAQRTRHTRRSKVRRRVYQAAVDDLFRVLCV